MILFRDGIEADLPTVVRMLADDRFGRLRDALTDPIDPAYVAAYHRMIAQGGRLLLAELGGVVVGCLQFNVIHGIGQRGQTVAQVEGVRVDSARRGAGIGRALMDHAIAQARAAGCGTMQLTSRLDRTEVPAFYRALGFSQSHAGFKLSL